LSRGKRREVGKLSESVVYSLQFSKRDWVSVRKDKRIIVHISKKKWHSQAGKGGGTRVLKRWWQGRELLSRERKKMSAYDKFPALCIQKTEREDERRYDRPSVYDEGRQVGLKRYVWNKGMLYAILIDGWANRERIRSVSRKGQRQKEEGVCCSSQSPRLSW